MESPALIKDLKIGVRNVNLFFIVIDVASRATTTKEGAEVRACKVADRSACINLSIWGELGNFIQPGDICRMTKGYVACWKGAPTLYIGKNGELLKTGEFCMIFNETLNISEGITSSNSTQSSPPTSAGSLQITSASESE